MRKSLAFGILLSCAVVWPGRAWAGGFDTPMLYTAQHMGMGGVAVSFVDDPSALFHNPAGLARAPRFSVLGDFSALLGQIQASPATGPATGPINLESDVTFAPFFLLGAAWHIIDWLAVGLAVYPVASAGGAFEYENAGGTLISDGTKLFFLEISPGIAFNLPYRITLGASYRVTMVSLTRTQGPVEGDPALSMELSGWSFLGFRVGAQWEAIEDHLHIGMTYRHRTDTEVRADEIRAVNLPFYDVTSSFTLPSQLSMGVRGDLYGLGLGVDVAVGFNSQNVEAPVEGNAVQGDDATRALFANIYEWRNSVTVRAGLEYTVSLLNRSDAGLLRPRIGYVFDGQVSSPVFSSAFGTPPGPTHVMTAGLGYDGGPWEINLAYAYRFGRATVTQEDFDSRDRACAFCSYPGDYAISMHGIYLDLSWEIDWPAGRSRRSRGGAAAPVDDVATEEPVSDNEAVFAPAIDPLAEDAEDGPAGEPGAAEVEEAGLEEAP